MKVSVKKISFDKAEYAPKFPMNSLKNEFDSIIEAENSVKLEEKLRRRNEQEGIAEKYEHEYYKIFPNDPLLGYSDDVDNVPSFDPWIMTNMYLWAIENKRHFWEWPDLPKSYEPVPQTIIGII